MIAGTLLTLSGIAIYFSSEYTAMALVLLLFVSLNLAQSGFTRFCMMELILKKMGFRSELDEIRDLVIQRDRLRAEDKVLQEIDRQVLLKHNLAELLQFICTEVSQLFDYPYAWIGRKQDDGTVSISAWAGNKCDYYEELKKIGVRWDDTPEGQGPVGSCIRSNQIVRIESGSSCFLARWKATIKNGFKTVVGIPLVVNGQVYGAFALYSREEKGFGEESLQRLQGISRRICMAIEMSIIQERLHLQGTALASAGNAIFITDQRGAIQWVNQSFTRLSGYSAEEAIGQPSSLLKSGKHDAAHYQKLWETILQGKIWSSEIVERHKNGKLLTAQQSITPIRNEDGNITHFISILDDITEQREAAERIHYMAHFDALTALPNRALFYDRLSQVLAHAKRDGESCALMFLDLDKFKSVNDTFGHQIGDLLLQEVASRIKACVRESDTVSRLAGDEFTVLLPHVRSNQDAASIAEKITAALSQPFYLSDHVVNAGSSTGIAFYPDDADSGEALIKCADSAMYVAKQQGRGMFSLYRPELAAS